MFRLLVCYMTAKPSSFCATELGVHHDFKEQFPIPDPVLMRGAGDGCVPTIQGDHDKSIME